MDAPGASSFANMPSTQRARPRGSYKKSAVSRRQVLEAAVQTLATSGYAKTSVNDIAKTAGMSKGAVHYHFESKDDLIAKVLEHCAAYSLDQLRQAWETPGRPREKVQRAVRTMRALRKRDAPELRVLSDLSAQGLYDERIRDLLSKMFEANRKAFVTYLGRSLSELQVQPRVPVQVIPRLLLAVLDGLAMHDYFDPPREGDSAEVEKALEEIALSLFEV